MCNYYLICKNKECQIKTPKIEESGFPKCFIRWFEWQLKL
jgi:hypothetical protein